MAAPECTSCSSSLSMELVRYRPLMKLPGSPGMRMAQGQRMRSSGHPLAAIGMSILGGAAFVANRFWKEGEYRCRRCGKTTTQTERK